MPSYKPQTINTSAITLGLDLEELTEGLARNNHDHWAQRRMDEGWHYGVKRDDSKKEHPDLIPYEELPEPEKEYDRSSVIETLKAIIALGYEIRRRG